MISSKSRHYKMWKNLIEIVTSKKIKDIREIYSMINFNYILKEILVLIKINEIISDQKL